MSDEVVAPSANSSAPTPPSGARVGYLGKPGLTKLLIKNFFLTVVTIGFYRFWARARLRRYFWSNILIAGEPLEYTGTGLELFLGFLIALAVLAPCGVAYVTLQRVMLGNPKAEAILSLCYFLGLIIFVQVVVFRARRYRLSRTTWRGIYAAQTGSAWRYLGLSLMWGVAMIATLGLVMPWRIVALERYKIDHSWFGESRFALDARARDLFPRWLIVLVLLVVPLGALIASNLSFVPEFLVAAAKAQASHQKTFTPPQAHALWLLAVIILGGGPALVWYWVTAFRYFTSRTRLGEVRLNSHARGSSVLTTVLLFTLGLLGVSIALTVVVLGVIFIGGIFLGVLSHGVKPNPMTIGTIVILGILPVYLAAIVGFQLVSYWWLRVPIIRHLATTLEIENLGAIDAVMQSAKPRQKFGIADSFDIGAI